MCEAADGIDLLKRVPFKVAALEECTQPGSCQRELARCVYDSVRRYIDMAIAQWEQERKEKGR